MTTRDPPTPGIPPPPPTPVLWVPSGPHQTPGSPLTPGTPCQAPGCSPPPTPRVLWVPLGPSWPPPDPLPPSRFKEVSARSKEELVAQGFTEFTIEDFHNTVRPVWDPLGAPRPVWDPLLGCVALCWHVWPRGESLTCVALCVIPCRCV